MMQHSSITTTLRYYTSRDAADTGTHIDQAFQRSKIPAFQVPIKWSRKRAETMQNEFSVANSELQPAREIGNDALKVVSVSIFTVFFN